MNEDQPNLLKYDYECHFADMNKIAQLSFFENYAALLKWTDEWKMKLEINLSMLEGEKERISYLQSVTEDIEYKLKPKTNQDFIKPYLKCYNLEIEDFPFLNNSKIKTLLSKNTSDQHEHILDECKDQKMNLRSMKLDFFDYAINLEILKIFDIINERLPGIGIFQSKYAEKVFNDLLNYLNIKDKIERGDQAKLAGIWQSKEARNRIFKKALLKKEYIEYINTRFGEKYRTKTFSAGGNHESFVDDWLSRNNYSSL